jgi:putative ABC transport system permease protein
VRMALGATPPTVYWMVLRESLMVAAAGFAIGAPAAIACSGLVRSLLYGVARFDAGTLMVALSILLATALAAAYIPARRAAAVDPMTAIRVD